MPAFLLKFWYIPVMAALLFWGGWERSGWISCQAEAASFAADAANKARDYQAADAAKGKEIADAFAAGADSLKGKLDYAQAQLAKVKPVAACAHTPAANAFDRGVRP